MTFQNYVLKKGSLGDFIKMVKKNSNIFDIENIYLNESKYLYIY